jgi:hypothetical protein
MSLVLDQRPADRETGMAKLQELVEHSSEERAKDLIWLFSRLERRREYLWAPMMIAQQSSPLERLFPAVEKYAPRGW